MARLLRNPAEEVAASHNDRDFDTHLADVRDLHADLVNGIDIDTEATSGGEGFA
jgi:hypothetical protein